MSIALLINLLMCSSAFFNSDWESLKKIETDYLDCAATFLVSSVEFIKALIESLVFFSTYIKARLGLNIRMICRFIAKHLDVKI